MKKKKEKTRGEIWWCIKSGSILLPYTAMSTRQGAIEGRIKDLLNMASFHFDSADLKLLKQGELLPYESVVRLRVMEEEDSSREG